MASYTATLPLPTPFFRSSREFRVYALLSLFVPVVLFRVSILVAPVFVRRSCSWNAITNSNIPPPPPPRFSWLFPTSGSAARVSAATLNTLLSNGTQRYTMGLVSITRFIRRGAAWARVNRLIAWALLLHGYSARSDGSPMNIYPTDYSCEYTLARRQCWEFH